MKGKITEEELKTLKALYKGALFRVSPDGKNDFVFKPISKPIMDKMTSLAQEAEKNQKELSLNEINQFLFDQCVLWPEASKTEMNDWPIGILPTLCKLIQEKSGFLDIDIAGRPLAPDIRSIQIQEWPFWEEPTEAEWEELKTTYKNTALIRLIVDGRWVFVMRPVTRNDLQITQGAMDEQFAVCKTQTVWPKDVDWDELPVGIYRLLSAEIYHKSGFNLDIDVEEI